MESKTHIRADEGCQELFITREFDLPADLLFRAYEEPAIVEQWMGTKVLKLENRPHGSWEYETSHEGKVVFGASGVILEFERGQKITRTFKMHNTPFPVQLEFMEFEQLTDTTSRLVMQIVFKSTAFRDQLLQMPFSQGINMAHNRLQEVLNNFKR